MGGGREQGQRGERREREKKGGRVGGGGRGSSTASRELRLLPAPVRCAQCELKVDEGSAGHEAGAHAEHLLARRRVRHDRHARRLRARPCRCGQQSRAGRLGPPRGTCSQTSCHHGRQASRWPWRVDRTAAAHSHQAVRPFVLGHCLQASRPARTLSVVGSGTQPEKTRGLPKPDSSRAAEMGGRMEEEFAIKSSVTMSGREHPSVRSTPEMD